MADNGIKGAEGGTHLRNILLSLGAPTDNAYNALLQFGGAEKLVYDESGNMRSLNDIFGDLNDILGSMQQNERTELLNTLFNKTDLTAVNALLSGTASATQEVADAIDAAGINWDNYANTAWMANNGLNGLIDEVVYNLDDLGHSAEEVQEYLQFEYDLSAEDAMAVVAAANTAIEEHSNRWIELSGYIDDAEGAAEAMADTQLDNLAGDITLFQSALEGAKIVLSDELSPTLREFVQFGSEAVSTLSTAFQEGGLSGAMEALGTILSEGLAMVIEKLPEVVEAGVGLLTALIQGIVDNFPLLIDAAGQIIVILAQGLAEALPDLLLAIPDMWLQVQGVLLEILPELLELGGTMLVNLVDGLLEKLPDLIDSAIELVDNLIDTIFENLPKIIDAGMQILGAIVEGILDNLPELIEAAGELLMKFLDKVLEYLPQLLESGIEFVGQMAEGVIKNLPAIIQSVTNVLNKVITFIMQKLPEFLKKGIEMVQQLAEGILDNLPEIIRAITQAIVTLIHTIAENLPEFLEKGIEILVQIAVGLIEAIPQLLAMLPQIFTAIIDAFGSVDWGSIGTALINGIVVGIQNGASAIWTAVQNAASSALNSVKNFLGIASPSKVFRDQVGQWIPAGIAEGIEENDDMIGDALDDTFDFGPQIMGNVNVSGTSGSSQAGLIQELLNKLDGLTVVLDSGEKVGRLTVPFNTSLGRQLSYDMRGI